MKIAYEISLTGDIFEDREMAEKYAEYLINRGHDAKVIECVVE